MNKNQKILIIGLSAASLVVATALFVNYRKKKIRRFALLFDGVSEIGNNSGFSNDAFQQMMKNVGWKGGEAWCMYFAKAVYVNSLPKLAQDFDKSLTGSTQGSWANVKNGKSDYLQIITEGSPKVGDIVIWQRTDNASKGHAGVVVKVKAGGSEYDAIEGNTNYDPAFNGEGDLVDVVPHETRYNQTDTTYSKLKLLGFIRLK